MKVFKGSALKEWFLSKPNVRRVLTSTLTSFHITNLDEIEDEEYYLMSKQSFSEVVIEEVELIEKHA